MRTHPAHPPWLRACIHTYIHTYTHTHVSSYIQLVGIIAVVKVPFSLRCIHYLICADKLGSQSDGQGAGLFEVAVVHHLTCPRYPRDEVCG